MGEQVHTSLISTSPRRTPTTRSSDASASQPAIAISDQSLVLDGDYYYYNATITNNSSFTLSYIQIDIFLYDKTGKMVDSEWTNWSGTLPPDGSARIDKMIRYYTDVARYGASVSDISIK